MNDYLSILVTLLIGLSITDMAISAHRLLRNRARVEWDWMSPLLAIIMLLQLLGFWWLWFGMYENWPSISVAQFLPDLAMFLLLFLACAAVLPDDVPAEGIALRAHYLANTRYFWTLFALYCALGTLVIGTRLAPPDMPWAKIMLYNLPNIALVAAGIYLAATKRIRAHQTALLLLAPYTLYIQLSATIAARGG